MLNIAEVKKEHELIAMICTAKLNEVFAIVDQYHNCEDKLHARLTLKHAGMAVNTLIVNGHLISKDAIPSNVQTLQPNEPAVNNEPVSSGQTDQAPAPSSEEPSNE